MIFFLPRGRILNNKEADKNCTGIQNKMCIRDSLNIPFTQEVVAVATALQDYAPDTDVAIELGGEDAKIIYFSGGIDQRMNGICAGGTGSFIDQMASLLQTDAAGLNEYAKNYKAIYPIAVSYTHLDVYKRQPSKSMPQTRSRMISRVTTIPALWSSSFKSSYSLNVRLQGWSFT